MGRKSTEQKDPVHYNLAIPRSIYKEIEGIADGEKVPISSVLLRFLKLGVCLAKEIKKSPNDPVTITAKGTSYILPIF